MSRITSPHNSVIKYVRSLERARTRREERAYLAEGIRLVSEALSTGQSAPLVLYDPEALGRSPQGESLLQSAPQWAERCYAVDERALQAASTTQSPSGILAVLRLPVMAPLGTHSGDSLGLILDRLADPGNAGTILRTADAVGVGYVVALPGTVDLYSPKVVRAGMGAHFRLSVYADVAWTEFDRELPDVECILVEARGTESIYQFAWPQRAAIVVGGEVHGISVEAAQRAAARVRIPMRSGVESLNASVAASIVMYSARGSALDGVTLETSRYK